MLRCLGFFASDSIAKHFTFKKLSKPMLNGHSAVFQIVPQYLQTPPSYSLTKRHDQWFIFEFEDGNSSERFEYFPAWLFLFVGKAPLFFSWAIVQNSLSSWMRMACFFCFLLLPSKLKVVIILLMRTSSNLNDLMMSLSGKGDTKLGFTTTVKEQVDDIEVRDDL